MADDGTVPRPGRTGRRVARLGRQWGWLFAVLLVVGFVAAVAVVANGRGARGGLIPETGVTAATTTPASGVAPVATAKPSRKTTAPTGPSAPVGIATVTLSSLPPEAAETWHLVGRSGPFPFREDGMAFENRDHRLPDQPLGWYREYTVPTPGVAGRGPRRLVIGSDRSPFWSTDGGATFVFVDASR